MAVRAYDPRGQQGYNGKASAYMRARVRSGLGVCCVVVAAAVAVLTLTPVASAQTPYAQVTTQPGLYPEFHAVVSDYVVRCAAGTPLNITVTAPAGTEVDVDGQGPRTGSFTTSVSLQPGQGFTIAVAPGQTHYVRCIPADMPRWTFQRSGQPQAEWYTASPFLRTDFQPLPVGVSSYEFLFDRNGVPVWWAKPALFASDFLVFPNGNLGSLRGDTNGKENRLDGSLVRNIVPEGASSDPHELLQLPNGNYLVTTLRYLPNRSYCTFTNREIVDNGAQEIQPDGTVVWTWWASDHISLSEVPTAWCGATDPFGVLDPFHINSLEPDGDDVLMSFRQLDAVYSLHKADGSVEWKLGGTSRPESLAVLNDPISAGPDIFRGQHDARVLSDGTVTIHDNGFHQGATRPPRAVRYAIDTNAKTATLVEQKNDPDVIATPVCCGDSRKLPGGNWLMSWGSTGVITELSPSGARIFKLTFDDGLFSYRSHPVPFGRLSRTALRAGMDAQFPRGYTRAKSAGMGQPLKVSLVPAFKECVAPDRTHGPPLASPSCSSPRLASNTVTVGTNDANGRAANSSGFVSYGVRMGNPSTTANEADVDLRVEVSDVRWNDNLSDYFGQLQLRGAVRITDRLNGSLENEAATGQDTEFPVLIQCTTTASTSTGGQCSQTTSLNAVVPGMVVEGKRATWQLGQVQLYDGGPTGYAGGSGATLFATQGIFVP